MLYIFVWFRKLLFNLTKSLSMDTNMPLSENHAMIETLRPDGKRGIWMHENDYYLLQTFVIETLEEHSQLTLPDLIEVAEKQLKGKLKEPLAYTLLHIKTDLITRKVIRQIDPENAKSKFPLICLCTRKAKTIYEPSSKKAMTIL